MVPKFTLMVAACGVALFSSQASNAAPVLFNYTGGFQTFVAPATGIYTILAFGAQGASQSFGAGGLGAEIGGDFSLTQGDMLTIAVGGAGVGSVNFNGGGGGSFVVSSSNTPLVIAGGGGGTGISFAGGAGQITTSGGAGTGGSDGGAGGVNGFGGGAGTGFLGGSGGGGGGFFGSGSGNASPDSGNSAGGGGNSYAAGLAGGAARFGGIGGFGGGGGGGFTAGGGGGGYSGGGGGGRSSAGGGGGGGSFLASTVLSNSNLVSLAGVRSGNGLVSVNFLSASAVPEPATWSMMMLGFGGVGYAMRRRKLSERRIRFA